LTKEGSRELASVDRPPATRGKGSSSSLAANFRDLDHPRRPDSIIAQALPEGPASQIAWEHVCCFITNNYDVLDRRQAAEVRDELAASEDRTRDLATVAATKPPDPLAWTFLILAWLVALAATLGALFIGEVMGQAPCNLCWFQRAFMFPLAIVLMVACLIADYRVGRYALPLAAIGWLVAFYHLLLFGGVIPEEIKPCGAGPSCSSADTIILGWLPIPALSLAAFTAIIVLLFLVRRRSL